MSHKIVYFHIGPSDYLPTSIKQLKHFNPQKEIYLIGNNIQQEVKDLVKFYEYEDLLCEQSMNFLHKFRNYSTNNADFEKICILRWFTIRNLCKKENFTNFFHLDSDVMIYCDLKKELAKFDSHRYSLSCSVSAAVFCVNDITVLDDYCNFVDGFYDELNQDNNYTIRGESKKMFKHIRDDILAVFFNRNLNNLPGGVSDMTFWSQLRRIDDPTMVGEISGIHGDSTFDHNINAADFFEFENGMKKIVWKDALPYSKNVFLNTLVRFNSLHFQGQRAKPLMEKFKSYQ